MTHPLQLLAEALPSGVGAAPGAWSVLSARSDAEAAAAWLQARAARSPRTFEAYRREVLRLLLWLYEQDLSFGSLKVEGVHAFYAHLRDPPAHWLCPAKPRRDEVLLPTQMLRGPLSPKSIAYTRTVLGQLFAYLADGEYIRGNAFRLSGAPGLEQQDEITRFIDPKAWVWLWRWLMHRDAPDTHTALLYARDRFLFALLYHTGLRLSEIAKARMLDFVRKDERWFLFVVGKGRKKRHVPINSVLMTELRRFRALHELPELPSPAEAMPLVPPSRVHKTKKRVSTEKEGTLTPRAVALRVDECLRGAAASCADEHIRAQLAAASTHWMRHTHGTHALNAGTSANALMDTLGHVDPKTTRLYAKTFRPALHDEAEKLAQFHRDQEEKNP